MVIPVSGGMANVMGTSSAIAIVAERPGMAPTKSPSAVPPHMASMLFH